jgi:hypothetical protein
MLGSLPLRVALALGVTLMIAVGCGSTVTNVGSVLDDSGAPDAPGPTDQDGSTSGGDASADALGDGALDAHADAQTPCAAGACGASICGRDECGHTCGTCPGAPAQGGCFTGHCIASCPGTPCLDHNGEHVCEGGRGGHACTGGSLGIQVCTCSGGGADAWTSCGACL